MTTTLAVETRRLTKIYGSGHTEVVAMRDVSMAVKRGEVVALLGPSGSGKSTFLTAVGLINPPSSGEIRINGTLVQDGSRAAVNITAFRRNNIGFIFQKANLIPFLSAGMLPIKGVTRGINYGSDKVRFTNMVRVGKRVRLRQKLIGAEPRSGGLQIKNECTIEIEGEERPACVAETISIVYGA